MLIPGPDSLDGVDDLPTADSPHGLIPRTLHDLYGPLKDAARPKRPPPTFARRVHARGRRGGGAWGWSAREGRCAHCETLAQTTPDSRTRTNAPLTGFVC